MKKILIIGVGSIGKRYLQILTKKKIFVGIYDKKKINLAVNNFLIFKNFKEIKRWCPDAVIISTTANSHAAILKKFKKINTKLFLIEKPITLGKKDAELVKIFSKKYKKKIYMVSNLRFLYPIKKIKKIIKSLGRPLYSHIYYNHNFTNLKSKDHYIFKDNKYWGGIIYDCIHEIDIILFLFGSVKNVYCKNYKLNNIIKSEDFSNIFLEHKNKIYSTIDLGFINKIKERGLEIKCEKGEILLKSSNEKKNSYNFEIIRYSGLKREKEIIFRNKKIDHNAQYEEMINNFLNIKKFNKLNKNLLCTLNEGIEAVKLVDKCYKSNKTSSIEKC